ncbi:POK18 protein, partial [Origma solitaria]|nr:POK18 protein [Origma solitaria]
ATNAIIVHYMDDILVCAAEQGYLDWALSEVISALKRSGMEIQSSKVQRQAPWDYLGMRIREQTIVPQPIKLIADPKTLQETQQ